jgi:hypothetical protein
MKYGTRNEFVPHILNVVSIINRMSLLTHYFINLHVHRIISEHGPVPSDYDPEWYDLVIKALPDFSYQNWYNMVCNAIVPCNGVYKDQKDPAIMETYQVFKNLYPDNYDIPDRQSLGLIQNLLTKNIKASVLKHLNGNMPKRINAYLKVVHEISNPGLRGYITSNIMEGPSEHECKYDTDLNAQRLIQKYGYIFALEREEIRKRREIQKTKNNAEKAEMEERKKETGKTKLEILQSDITALVENEDKKKHTRKRLTSEEKEAKKSDELSASRKLSRNLIFQYQLLMEIEKKEGKRWSLLPTKGSYIDSHIAISNECMVDLLKSYYLEDTEKPRAYFEKMEEKIWSEIFKIPPNRGNYLFNHYMTTDGYSVSLNYKISPNDFVSLTNVSDYNSLSFEEKFDTLVRYNKIKDAQRTYQKEKEEEKKKQKKLEEEEEDKKEFENILKMGKKSLLKSKKEWNKTIEKSTRKERIERITKSIESDFNRILGLDPGNRSLFTCVDKSECTKENPYGKVLKCDSKEFKHLTGDTQRTKERNKRKDSQPVLIGLKDMSLKTSNYEKYKNNLQKLLKVEEQVLDEYRRLWYRKINFTGYIKKQKTFAMLAKRLQGNSPQEKVLIGWGNGGDGSKLKGSKVPGKGFKNYVKRNTKMKVMDIDENLTTKMCSKCCDETVKIKAEKDINEKKRRNKEDKEKREEKREKLNQKRNKNKIQEVKEKKEEVNNDEEYLPVFKNVEIYGLRNCKKCHMIWNRDENASENITELTLCQLEKRMRPKYLRRKKLPKTSLGLASKSPQSIIPRPEGVIQPENNVVHLETKKKIVLSLSLKR